MFVTKGQVDPPSYDSQGERLVGSLMCFTEPSGAVFSNPRLLQNPRVIQVHSGKLT